jgi:hypothetical protein
MEMNDIYNDLPLYVKEAASMPMAYHQLSIDQQLFFMAMCDKVKNKAYEENKFASEDVKESLNAIMADMESVIDEL